MPIYEVSEYHEVTVHAPIDGVYDALRTTDLGTSLIVRALLRMRAFPRLLSRQPRVRDARIDLDSLLKNGFVLLGEHPPTELALGLVGRFWLAADRTEVNDVDEFREFDQSGYAKAVWNFSVVESGPGAARLATETRVRCLDERSRTRFRLYWSVIAPFSGLIRRQILHTIRRYAEPTL